MATPAGVSVDTASPEQKGLHLSHNLAARAEPAAVTGGENTVLTQALPHVETFADRHPPSAVSTLSASVTAVPVAPSHAATGTVGNHPVADRQQQQTPGQPTSDASTAAFPTSAGSSPQVHVHSHRHQGPISLGIPMRNPPLRSTAAIYRHAGSSATAGTGNLAHASAPLQAAFTPGSATRPRSPVLVRPSPPPAPPHATDALNLNTGPSAVSPRAASSDTSPNIAETRAAANSPGSVHHPVAAAHAHASSVLLPGFLASLFTSAVHSPGAESAEPLPDTAYPGWAGRSHQTGDDTTGSNSFFWAARLLRWLWDSLVFCFWVPYNCSKFRIQVGGKLFLVAAVLLVALPAIFAGFGAFFAGLGLVTMLFFMPVITLAKLLGLLDEPPQQPSRQAGGQMAPITNRQPQSPTTSVTLLPQQMGSSRQSQTQAMPPLHSPAPATDPFFTTPDGADQPLISALMLSRCAFIEQQAAILAAAHRHRGSRSGPTPAGTREGDSSAAGPSMSAAAGAVPVNMPTSGRASSSGSRTAIESEDQPSDVCVVCMDADKDWFCLPCRHLAMCRTCISRIAHTTRRCPICQQYIMRAEQVYRV